MTLNDSGDIEQTDLAGHIITMTRDRYRIVIFAYYRYGPKAWEH